MTQQPSSRGRTAAVLLAGLALIVVLAPLSQFMTLAMTNTDMETASPSGWAFGILFSLGIAAVLLRTCSRFRLLDRAQLVILYGMLTIAVPVMNLGLVRPLFLSLRSVQFSFVQSFVNTYRTAYRNQSPDWFPVVPTAEGLAWNKAERLLRLLREDGAVHNREQARRLLAAGVSDRAAGEALIARLGADELASLRTQRAADPEARASLERLGLIPVMDAREATMRTLSAGAAARLRPRLPAFDEQEIGYVPARYDALDRPGRKRLDEDRKSLPPGEEAGLARRIEAASQAFPELRAEVSGLTRADWEQVRDGLAAVYRERFAALTADQLAMLRTSFLYRSSGAEREDVFSQDGLDGRPNQNLQGMYRGLWRGDDAARLAHEYGIPGTARLVLERIPWTIWAGPLIRWGILVTVIFLFLMCLAEWLRRRWIERENLAFPLVELADYVIRPDCELETAADLRSPLPRRRLFSGLFLAGCGLGGLILLLEALSHYGLVKGDPLIGLDVSRNLFASGAMREMGGVVLMLSPILVGILFLVSREITLSIWVLFVVYKAAELAARLAFGDIKDSAFTGWAGGRFFPFPMEQLLGASLCFMAVLLVKSIRTGRPAGAPSAAGSYVPPRLAAAGLALLPLAAGVLLWQLGVAHLPFLLLVAVILLALTLAAARLRAETGLHTQHVTYEFSKLPMVLGLTGWTGARVYTTFISLAFLPVTLLFRLLPQQLENMELARRNGVACRRMALAALLAFPAALAAGLFSFLVLNYYFGNAAAGAGAAQGPASFDGIVQYPLWVSHFLGENGLDRFASVHAIRAWFMLLGAAVFGGLVLLRGRFLGFPLHPLGYLAILMSVYYSWVSPYYKGAPAFQPADNTLIWGSAFAAWLLKTLIIKYGGMNGYRKAKPFFIGLACGALLCLFLVNAADLAATLRAGRSGAPAGSVLRIFTDKTPYTPQVY